MPLALSDLTLRMLGPVLVPVQVHPFGEMISPLSSTDLGVPALTTMGSLRKGKFPHSSLLRLDIVSIIYL